MSHGNEDERLSSGVCIIVLSGRSGLAARMAATFFMIEIAVKTSWLTITSVLPDVSHGIRDGGGWGFI